ncbi:MAG: diphthamide biosynthesis enzyme Dph2 [Thermoprotei archaeon]|nr:MAG: diphthamide biosynthesis enzyme Dph2 [Thermoprotei archaeon]
MNSNSLENIPYDFELGSIINFLKSKNAKSILIQLPDGLKHYFPYISSELKKRVPELKIYLSGHPTYGPCTVDEESAKELGVDIIIHFGHLEYPFYTPKYETIFIPAKSKLRIGQEPLLKLKEILEEKSCKSVAISSPAQHLNILSSIALELKSYGFDVNIAKQPILGCYYNPALSYEVDAHIVVAGGAFHAIGMWLASQKPTIRVDPYESRVEDITFTAMSILKKRLWRIHMAMDSYKWAIIDGAKGQSRTNIVKKLEEQLLEKGLEYIVVKANRIDAELLRNLGTSIDAYIITACPRIAIDDLSDFEKPVLAPGEAYYALGMKKRYVFPW